MSVDPKVEGSSPFESTINNTVIDARGRGTVVTFGEGEDQSCLLAGLTLTNGGGIYGSNSDMIIEGCSIYKNQASNFHGGGIYVTDGSRPQILSNSIMDNVASSTGGGFASQDGSSTTLVFNKVYNNSAMDGGGIYVANSAKTRLANNMIYRNRSTGTSSGRLVNGGGGMQLWGAPILCENCVFYDNEAVVEGGAIQCAYTDHIQRAIVYIIRMTRNSHFAQLLLKHSFMSSKALGPYLMSP